MDNTYPLPRIQYALAASLLVLILLLAYYFLPKTTEGYIDDLANEDVRVRISAAKALGQTREIIAVPALLNALKDPREEVRLFAARSLAPFKIAENSGPFPSNTLM